MYRFLLISYYNIVMDTPGYHLRPIEKGQYGTLSKIYEEVEEIRDSEAQNNRIMILLELSDLLGAVRGYLEENYPEITLNDLAIMADATQRAFLTGVRK